MRGNSMKRRSVRESWRSATVLAVCGVVAMLGFDAASVFADARVPFSASGTILTINTGKVKQAGDSECYIVKDRQITGALTGSIGGIAGVPFVMTFNAIVSIENQAGQFRGRMVAGIYEANLSLTSSAGPTPVECEDPDGVTCIATPAGNFVPGLLLNGKMNFLGGTQGRGTVTGWVIPVLDEQGHVVSIVASQLTLAGRWIP
jgi:hypothetical protein